MRVFRKTALVSLGLAAFICVFPLGLHAEVFCSKEDALKAVLPEASDFKEEIKVLTAQQKKTVQVKAGVELDPEFDKEFYFYVSSSGTAVLDTVKGKWGPIKFIMAFDTQGKIKDVVVLELTERRGRPVKDRKFLDQYIGKSAADPIKLKKDIKGIAGATISSRQMTDGIRKLVYIYEELYKK